MEAANRGASEAGDRSVGFNITLPQEQEPNPYITPELSFQFHYFFMRKLWFAYMAKVLIVFPGGYGTLDELMELLTLVQTQKIRKPILVIVYGSDYWQKLINFDVMEEAGTISPSIDCFEHANTWKNRAIDSPCPFASGVFQTKRGRIHTDFFADFVDQCFGGETHVCRSGSTIGVSARLINAHVEAFNAPVGHVITGKHAHARRTDWRTGVRAGFEGNPCLGRGDRAVPFRAELHAHVRTGRRACAFEDIGPRHHQFDGPPGLFR